MRTVSRRLILMAVSLVVSLTVTAGAAPVHSANTNAPELGPQLGALAPLVGLWRVSGKTLPDEAPFNMVYRLQPALGGAWMHGAGEVVELGLELKDYWTVEAGTNNVFRIILQSNGARAELQSSGWSDVALHMQGELTHSGQKIPVRQTITRVDDERWEVVWEQMTDETWSAYAVETLVRLNDSAY